MGSLDCDIPVHDVLIIGAGLSGVCALHHLRAGFPDWSIKCLERGPSVGGTWYWNAYPGARVDTESVSYSFSFDRGVLDEWTWKETFAAQPDILAYIQFVARKKDLLRDIQFNTRVRRAAWQETSGTWQLDDEAGGVYRTRFLVTCIGFLSSPTRPAIPGLDRFAGASFHTSQWPRDLTSSGGNGGGNNHVAEAFAGKRVGVIGTGASGIQTITALAKNVPALHSLHVFQRTANWSAPLRNAPISAAEMAQIRRDYDALFARCATTPGGFLHAPDPRSTADVTAAEREAVFEALYAQPGFAKWIGLFRDTYSDRDANALYSRFMADKIRARVHDAATAERLIPRDHGIGTRRIPLESGYFESYNLPHVHLVDLKATPLVEATPAGLVTADGTAYDLDVLIYATGFNAITGAFADIEWRGRDGRPLLGYSSEENGSVENGNTKEKDKGPSAVWIDHRPQTFLGTAVPDMPNLLMVMGPHQPFGNAARNIEHSVDLVARILRHCKDHGLTRVVPTDAAVRDWTAHVAACSEGSLINEIDSWMTGVNKNVRGRTERTVARYAGSAVEYRKRCQACQDAGWAGLEFS
ncbi:Flavin monooxygenase-like protein [Niveomyces insectorum RCEF 264]|uniref:Flavin monooxygenase-like protein n=1 Tax=Niveomyces insectorum RCEF 264 TaxID=1081102 RepID=A0A167S3B2_9HYPO|nr:Flavin monooxygenase-like protein [Niveomyces insectorum RCEF 264]